MTLVFLARRYLLFAALAACVAGPARAADDDAMAEYQVKAAFVSKFGNYVDWPTPPAAGEPLRIGVLASSAVVEEFRRVAALATVAGRPLELRRLARGDPTDGLHIVFVSRAMSAHVGDVLATTQGRPVLTVTELDPAAATGMINFVVVDDKVRFDVSLTAATQSGLKISVRLLSVARRVEGKS